MITYKSTSEERLKEREARIITYKNTAKLLDEVDGRIEEVFAPYKTYLIDHVILHARGSWRLLGYYEDDSAETLILWWHGQLFYGDWDYVTTVVNPEEFREGVYDSTFYYSMQTIPKYLGWKNSNHNFVTKEEMYSIYGGPFGGVFHEDVEIPKSPGPQE